MKKHTLFVIFILFLFSACNTGARVLSYDNTRYPAKPDDFNIQIIDRDDIDKDFKVIAQVSDDVATVYDSEQQVIFNLMEAARNLGGDGLIDLETETIDTSYDWIPSSKTIYKAKVIIFQ